MYNTQNISNRIKSMAKSKKVSIKNMLSDLGLGINTISQFAKGQVMSSINLARIADYLECSVDYLLGRTDDPTWNKPAEKVPIIIEKHEKSKMPEIMLPYYPQSASAGDGNYIFDELPEWRTVPKNSKTEEADFMLMVSGESMLPKFADGDIILVKKTPSIFEGEIGIFYIDGDAFIKQMGSGELISLNPDYPNIAIKTCNDVRCFGQVIGLMHNYE